MKTQKTHFISGKYLAVFIIGMLSVVFTYAYVTIDNGISSAIQVLQKAIFTSDGTDTWTTGVVIDGVNAKVLVTSVCDLNGANCKLVSQLNTGAGGVGPMWATGTNWTNGTNGAIGATWAMWATGAIWASPWILSGSNSYFTGNVGIGTGASTNKLTVNWSSLFYGDMLFSNSNKTIGFWSLFWSSSLTIQWMESSNSTWWNILMNWWDGGSDSLTGYKIWWNVLIKWWNGRGNDLSGISTWWSISISWWNMYNGWDVSMNWWNAYIGWNVFIHWWDTTGPGTIWWNIFINWWKRTNTSWDIILANLWGDVGIGTIPFNFIKFSVLGNTRLDGDVTINGDLSSDTITVNSNQELLVKAGAMKMTQTCSGSVLNASTGHIALDKDFELCVWHDNNWKKAYSGTMNCSFPICDQSGNPIPPENQN